MTTTMEQVMESMTCDMDRCKPGEPATMEALSVGEVVWQGDLGLMVVDAPPPKYVRVDSPEDADRQLVLGQVRQLAVQSIMAARAQPLRGVLAVAGLRAQVEFDRQLQVVHAIAVTQQHVQLAQGMPGAADRQVGGEQFHTRRMSHGELPQAFVVQAQATGA